MEVTRYALPYTCGAQVRDSAQGLLGAFSLSRRVSCAAPAWASCRLRRAFSRSFACVNFWPLPPSPPALPSFCVNTCAVRLRHRGSLSRCERALCARGACSREGLTFHKPASRPHLRVVSSTDSGAPFPEGGGFSAALHTGRVPRAPAPAGWLRSAGRALDRAERQARGCGACGADSDVHCSVAMLALLWRGRGCCEAATHGPGQKRGSGAERRLRQRPPREGGTGRAALTQAHAPFQSSCGGQRACMQP